MADRRQRGVTVAPQLWHRTFWPAAALIAALEGLRGAFVTLLAGVDLEPAVLGLSEAEVDASATTAKGAMGDKGALDGEVGMGMGAIAVGVLGLLLLTMGNSGKESARGVVGDNGDIWRDGD